MTRADGGPTGFEVVGEITQTVLIAQGRRIKDLARLRRSYGAGTWKKMKGLATVRLADDTIWKAEVHWYEAHGIGRKELKLKRLWHE